MRFARPRAGPERGHVLVLPAGVSRPPLTPGRLPPNLLPHVAHVPPSHTVVCPGHGGRDRADRARRDGDVAGPGRGRGARSRRTCRGGGLGDLACGVARPGAAARAPASLCCGCAGSRRPEYAKSGVGGHGGAERPGRVGPAGGRLGAGRVAGGQTSRAATGWGAARPRAGGIHRTALDRGGSAASAGRAVGNRVLRGDAAPRRAVGRREPGVRRARVPS